jgi:DNA mismatch repair protein MutS2
VIDLHGLIVEDAMELLDKFIDSAIVNRAATVKIIHGHGSGRLRNAVRKYLDAHPNVTGYQFGAPWEGGLAVTVARLATA